MALCLNLSGMINVVYETFISYVQMTMLIVLIIGVGYFLIGGVGAQSETTHRVVSNLDLYNNL